MVFLYLSLMEIFVQTPIGMLQICGDENGINSLRIVDEFHNDSIEIPSYFKDCVLQLKEYFEKKRTNFSFKINPSGSPFQQKVWGELSNIPYGKTISYLELSKKIGNTKAIRAVASANGKNPLLIVIPCHRVIGSDGSLTGYAGGLWRKQWLLEHENETHQEKLF